MAAPHVAGAAALVLEAEPGATPSTVAGQLLDGATRSALRGLRPGSPNALLRIPEAAAEPAPEPEPQPEPDPGTEEPSAPCRDCQRLTGTLDGDGDRAIEPNGELYEAGAGTHRAWLEGPADADFDLRLYRWNGRSWSEVARSVEPESTERVRYDGPSGSFVWTVTSYRGAGSYELYVDTP
jgi:subtilisin family serine protease